MNDRMTDIFVYLCIFWSGVIILNIFFAPYISQFTNADFDNLKSDRGNTIEAFSNLFNIMFFQVTSEVPFWISVILDVIAVLSIVVVFGLLFKG